MSFPVPISVLFSGPGQGSLESLSVFSHPEMHTLFGVVQSPFSYTTRKWNRKLQIKFLSPEAIHISRCPFFRLSMTHDADCDSSYWGSTWQKLESPRRQAWVYHLWGREIGLIELGKHPNCWQHSSTSGSTRLNKPERASWALVLIVPSFLVEKAMWPAASSCP